MKVLVHDGIGVGLAARRLNQGKFHWPGIRQGSNFMPWYAARNLGRFPMKKVGPEVIF